jgi:hypothetical protein
VDSHHFGANPDADPDLTYHLDVDPDSDLFERIRMRILILFDADADPDADPDYQNDADPDPQHWMEGWCEQLLRANYASSQLSVRFKVKLGINHTVRLCSYVEPGLLAGSFYIFS